MILSAYPDLAVSKMAGFIVGVIVVVALFTGSHREDRIWMATWFVSLLFWTVALLCAPLVFSPTGYPSGM